MRDVSEIQKAILSDTATSPSCGLGIHLPDTLDGYYFWDRWDSVKRPYRRDNDEFAAALDGLVEDGRLVLLDGRLDMYVHPSAFVDDENDVFVSEIDYLVFDEANRQHLRELYKRYRLSYIEPEDPGMEWYAPPDVWSDVIDSRVNEIVLDYRFSNDWDSLVVGCDRITELANVVGQQSHPLITHGFDHLIAYIQKKTPGRHMPSRIRHVGAPAQPVPWLVAITILLVVLVMLRLFE